MQIKRLFIPKFPNGLKWIQKLNLLLLFTITGLLLLSRHAGEEWASMFDKIILGAGILLGIGFLLQKVVFTNSKTEETEEKR